MALEPAFAVSAASPVHHGYDPSGNPSANAYLFSYGGNSRYYPPFALADQLNNDDLIVGFRPADPADEADLTDLVESIYKHSTVHLHIRGYNLRTDHQYMLVYELKQPTPTATPLVAQFFVGTKWIRSETIDDPTETVALLFNVPAPDNINVFMRLAADYYWASLGLSGITGYIL